MYSRRQFGKAVFAGLSLSTLPVSRLWAATHMDSTVHGVKLGIITGSLNPIPMQPGIDMIDTVIQNAYSSGGQHRTCQYAS